MKQAKMYLWCTPVALIYRFAKVTKVLVRNLNKIIDLNWYPVEEARNSNMKHRPMGIGVQGLADTFIKVGNVKAYYFIMSFPCCVLMRDMRDSYWLFG